MRTIPISRLNEGQEIAQTCVQFGFCTSVCPTYLETGDENDSPRGRIALIKEMLGDEAAPSAEAIHYLDRCLSCLSCAITCAASVDYGSLIDIAREHIEQSGQRPFKQRLGRHLLHFVMLRPRLMGALIRTGRPFFSLSDAFPAPLQALAQLAKTSARMGLDKDDSDQKHIRAAARAGKTAQATAQGRVVDILQEDGITAASRMDRQVKAVALLEGCAQSVVGIEINQAARRVLQRCGISVIETPKAGCCGAMSLHMGYRQEAEARARDLVNQWHELLEQRQIDQIVITTSGCGSVIRDYAPLFAQDPEMYQRAKRVAKASVDISEYLRAIDLPAPAKGHLGARVAYHDSCSLSHGQKVTLPPRKVLQSLGFEVLDIAERHVCCGSAGVYNILQPEMAQRLGRRKANHISTQSPDVFTAGNLGCLVQIGSYADIPGAHFVQLVDWATGGPVPQGLEHFVPMPDEKNQPQEAAEILWEGGNPDTEIAADKASEVTTSAANDRASSVEEDSFW